MKKCRKCSKVKDLTEFHTAKRNKDGKSSYCKQCACECVRQHYREKHPEKYVPVGIKIKKTQEQNKIAKYGKDLMDLHDQNNDSISYDDAMHEIRGY